MNELKKYLTIVLSAMFLLIVGCVSKKKTSSQPLTDSEIDLAWQQGETLPASVAAQYPLPLQSIKADNGINIMIDLAHQCNFANMWQLPRRLNQLGFRAIGSQASLNTVLDPDGHSRVRVHWDKENKIYPFVWHPNFSYNTIITHQSDPNAQEYLPEEQDALEGFVRKGGGLVIVGAPVKDETVAKEWSLNELCKRFDAEITADRDKYENISYAVINHNDKWEVTASGENGMPVSVYRKFGKGHVTIIGHSNSLQINRDDVDAETKNKLFAEMLTRVSEGKKPVGGEPRYPASGGGGGGIYPELEKQFDDIVLFYAANQKPELLEVVDNDIPKAKSLVEGWIPSRPTLEPMYLILSSGNGGGWAVNAFRPKENGIISLSSHGILSIFAHELAHTMHGPVNAEGEVAGRAPIPNRGEAHAGWFQGKVDAWFKEDLRDEPVKKCNSLFNFDPNGNELDLVTHYENEKLREEYGKGKDWTKTWWIWQKLDDRYGSTWYPRWKWVQHTRWAGNPDHRLSWDEMVEDMSIAVGEDLFPFLNKAGLSLDKKRLASIEFQGKELKLDIAPITVSKAGKVRLEEIGDYTKELSIIE